MDYHTLPRRQLQTLCKKHGIPANSTNSDMADALITLLKPKPQPHTGNSKQLEKRATRSSKPASDVTVSNSEGLEEDSNRKDQGSRAKQEDEGNKKPRRATRCQESASVATQEPKSAECKAEKTLPNSETASDSVSRKQGTQIREKSTERENLKVASTRKGASKQNNREGSAERENLIEESLKVERKKDRTGGIVLRRGRVKVRSPGNQSKSSESMEKLEITADSEGNKTTVKGGNSQSCLVDTKKTSQTRKKKRSVTFSDVVEIKLKCPDDAPGEDALEISGGACEDHVEMKAGEILEFDRNSQKSLESACVAKKVVGTRKASRNSSRKDLIQKTTEAQAGHLEEPVSQINKAEELHVFDDEKSADIQTGKESVSTRSVRGRRISMLVGEGTVKVHKEEKVVDSFVEGNLIENAPSVLNTRRSRRLTIVPTDVNCKQDKDMGAEKLQVKAQDNLESSSIAPMTIGNARHAKTSQKGRRMTLATLEPNQVQFHAEGASEQMEKVNQVSKGKDTRIKSEVKNMATELPEPHQKPCETTISKCTPVVTEAEGKLGMPIKPEVLHTDGNLRSSRRKTLMAPNKMDEQEEDVERSVRKTESRKTWSKSRPSGSILVCSEPGSLQKAAKEEEAEVKSTSVVPRSTRRATKISMHRGEEVEVDVTAVSQMPAFDFEMQSNRSEQDCPAYRDEAVDAMSKESEGFDVTAKAYIEHSLESPVLKNTESQDAVNLPSNGYIIDNIGIQSVCHQPPVGNALEQNQDSCEDASIFACHEHSRTSSVTATHSSSCDPETADLCVNDVGSSSITASHSPTGDTEIADSSWLVDTEPIKATAAAIKSGQITEETLNNTPSKCEQQGPESSIEEDISSHMKAMLVEEPDELITNSGSMTDIKENLKSCLPISVPSLDDAKVDGNQYMNGNDLEKSLVSHIDETIKASSPVVYMESTFEHQNAVDKKIPEQELCGSEMHFLESARDELVNLTSSGAADLILTKEISAVVDFNLCDEQMAADKEEVKCHGDLNEDQLQDTIEGVLCEGERTGSGRSTSEEQPEPLLPLLPLRIVTPGSALLRESACKPKQRLSRSIYNSARKAKSAVPWESKSCDKEDSDNDEQHTHGMSHDEVDSSSSEEEESSRETEESLSDTEIRSFNTEVLNSEEENSYSEDNTESDSEEATEFDSEEDFTEMELELTSGEECYAKEELDTSEEELSESEEDDSEDDTITAFDNSKASQASQSEEDKPVEHNIAEFKSSLPINEVIQGEAQNCPDIGSVIGGCFLNVGIAHTDVNTSEESKDFKEITGIFVSVTNETSEIQSNVDKLLLHDHTISVDNVQSTTDSTRLDHSWLPSLSSLFATPLLKVKEDVNCLPATPSEEISERNASQQSKTPATGSAMVDYFHVPAELDSVEESCALDHTISVDNMQSTTDSTRLDHSWLPSMSSLFATPLSKVKENVNCLPATPCEEISERNASHQSKTPATGSAMVDCLYVPAEIDSVEDSCALDHSISVDNMQSTTDSTRLDHSWLPSLSSLFATPLSKVKEDVNCLPATPSEEIAERNASQQPKTPATGSAMVDRFHVPAELDSVEESCALESKAESGCLGSCELSLKSSEVASSSTLVVEGSLDGNEAAEVSEVKSRENDIKHQSLASDKCCGIIENITQKLRDEDVVALNSAYVEIDSTHSVLPSDSAKEGEPDMDTANIRHQSLTSDNDCCIDDITQELRDEDVVAINSAYVATDTTRSVLPSDLAEEREPCMDSADAKLHEISPEMICNLSERHENLTNPEHEQLQSGGMGKEAESIQAENNVESLVSDVIASKLNDVDKCSTPKCSRAAEISNMFDHESLMDVLTTMQCVEVECQSGQEEGVYESAESIQAENNVESEVMASKLNDVEKCSTPKCSRAEEILNMLDHESLMDVITSMQCVEVECQSGQEEGVYEKASNEIQVSEEQDKEIPAAPSSAHEVSKEQSMQQINLTLMSLRKLKELCKGNGVSAPKKSETETPARKPFNTWMSASKQVNQPSTSTHPRELPSANKRSALKALSSNIKSTPSTAVQTPTAKVIQRPRNLMGTYDGKEGTGKHLVTPSSQAPKSSRKDLARSHLR